MEKCVCTQEGTIKEISKGLAELRGKLDDGLEARVRLIERMQWWQIGILVSLLAALIGGMWTMLQHGSAVTRENQMILRSYEERLHEIESRVK